MDAETRKALRPLVEPARAHLRDLDPDLVPHRLRSVLKSSARSLPAPLEKSLIEAIADDEALREAVADRWRESDRTDEFVEAFLAEPEDAAGRAEEVVAAAELEQLRLRVVDLESDNADLRAMATEARQRMARERETFGAELRQEKAADKRARSSLESRANSAEASARVLESELAEARDALSSERRRVESLEQDMARLRARAARADHNPKAGSPPGRSAIPTDPGALARWLDDSERVLRPFREQDDRGATGGSPRRGPSIPDGVSPDSAEALEIVLFQRPQLVVIDGYNLAGALGCSPIHSADARSSVILEASSMRRRSGARVMVVFDAVGVDGRSGFVTDNGVEVIFAMDRLADDEVVAIAAASGESVVVISNDRDVRERASLEGAVTLWSTAVVAPSNP